MKVTLLLGEAATAHPDGTVSILRAGITNVWGPKLPVHLIAALVVKIDSQPAESGSHAVEIRVIDTDGHDVAPRLSGNFNVGPTGGASNLILNFQIAFAKYGRYEFSTIIDRQLYGAWNIEVTAPPVPKGDSK
jgi:hypothetical protein